jgi:hypothetical protein
MTLVLSLVGPIIAVAVWWVGWQQMQIARAKLQHDLFDRRFKVYEAARDLLVSVRARKLDDPSLTDVRNRFLWATAESHFLLDASIRDYLMTLIDQVELIHGNDRALQDTDDPEERKRIVREGQELHNQFSKEFGELDRRFEPFLAYPELRGVPVWLEQLCLRARRMAGM